MFLKFDNINKIKFFKISLVKYLQFINFIRKILRNLSDLKKVPIKSKYLSKKYSNHNNQITFTTSNPVFWYKKIDTHNFIEKPIYLLQCSESKTVTQKPNLTLNWESSFNYIRSLFPIKIISLTS